MQNDDEVINRRTFLKLGAAELAVSGSTSLLPQAIAEEAGMRGAPAKPVTLRSSFLEVILDAADGLPFEYRLRKSDVRFTGESTGGPLNVKLHRREPGGFASVAVRATWKQTLRP